MQHLRFLCSFAFATLATASFAQSRCVDSADLGVLVRKYVALETWPNPDAQMTMADGVCSRDKFLQRLGDRLGPVVGYKAGLTNPAVQKRFNFNAPVRGTLFESMILRDAGQGVDVAAKFGARPLFEADLVVEVADSRVHNATTPAEVLQYVSRIYPFMELPDLVVDDPSKLGGAQIVAINVGARLGVLGPPIAVQAAEALSERLRTMTIKLVDGSGKLLDEGKGSAILEHPLNAVIWLAKDLKANGITLKPGDLLSLGSFSRLLPPQSGQTVSAVYEGLNADATAARVTVRFK